MRMPIKCRDRSGITKQREMNVGIQEECQKLQDKEELFINIPEFE